ncbi:hypothetical protein ACOMHN_025279 [Nucella lapillus]
MWVDWIVDCYRRVWKCGWIGLWTATEECGNVGGLDCGLLQKSVEMWVDWIVDCYRRVWKCGWIGLWTATQECGNVGGLVCGLDPKIGDVGLDCGLDQKNVEM